MEEHRGRLYSLVWLLQKRSTFLQGVGDTHSCVCSLQLEGNNTVSHGYTRQSNWY